MILTDKEKYLIRMILKTEILETKDLIQISYSKDKKELKEYLKALETINTKLN